MNPLMTSYQTEEVWLPPKDPFVTYEAKDESWCRYFGIGKVEKRPAKLYDVRYRDMTLAGYLTCNPKAYDIRICVIPKLDLRPMLGYLPAVKYEEIAIRKERLVLLDRFGRSEFTVWTIDSRETAERLISGKRMIPPSEDNLRRFERDLRHRTQLGIGY